MEEKFAGGKFREMQCALDFISRNTRKISVIQYLIKKPAREEMTDVT